MSELFTQKQLEIIQEAVKLFSDRGFDNTSVREIARKANVNVAMISYYFGSKEKLLEAIFQNYVTKIRDKIEAIVFAEHVNPKDKIDQIIDTYIDAISDNRNFHLLMVREQGVLKNPVLYEIIKKMKIKNNALIKSAVNAGVKQGYFRKNVDVSMLALTLFGSVNQAFNTRKFLSEFYHIDETDDAAFQKTVISKLKAHLKAIISSFLILDENPSAK